MPVFGVSPAYRRRCCENVVLCIAACACSVSVVVSVCWSWQLLIVLLISGLQFLADEDKLSLTLLPLFLLLSSPVDAFLSFFLSSLPCCPLHPCCLPFFRPFCTVIHSPSFARVSVLLRLCFALSSARPVFLPLTSARCDPSLFFFFSFYVFLYCLRCGSNLSFTSLFVVSLLISFHLCSLSPCLGRYLVTPVCFPLSSSPSYFLSFCLSLLLFFFAFLPPLCLSLSFVLFSLSRPDAEWNVLY